MPSRTEQLILAIRQGPIFQALGPMEAGSGWPIPYRKEGRLYMIVPFYGNRYDAAQKQTLLFPPLLTITVDWETGKPVEYVDLQFRNPWELIRQKEWSEPIGTFPHEAVRALTRDAYLEARNALLARYDDLFQALAGGAAIPEELSEAFSRLLRLLMEPPLEPYYRFLAQRFFERFLGPEQT